MKKYLILGLTSLLLNSYAVPNSNSENNSDSDNDIVLYYNNYADNTPVTKMVRVINNNLEPGTYHFVFSYDGKMSKNLAIRQKKNLVIRQEQLITGLNICIEIPENFNHLYLIDITRNEKYSFYKNTERNTFTLSK